ncbi:MAG: SoxR reducing system RseC family protein [Treponema sp.]|jgi:positive regulator of sigma E activity|nr:SoxR reducing system RseC family protein [Treponema sp.]
MRETGIVTALDGDFALVRVIRMESNGCGCGVTNRRQESLVRAKNLCAAEKGDKVHVETSHDRSQFRLTMQSALCVPAFVAGALAGEFAAPALGLPAAAFSAVLGAGAGAAAFSAALGAAAAVAVFVVFGRVCRKKPLAEPALYEVVLP